MKFLFGRDGLPAFREQTLQARLAAELGRPVRISTRSIFLLSELPDKLERLLQLLDAQELALDTLDRQALFVVPRRGTRSGWSSKAGDILKRCGFNSVNRIEHGLMVRFADLDSADVPEQARHWLFDRMTEELVDDFDHLSHWFDPLPPGELATIELGTDPMQRLHSADRAMGLALNEDEMQYLVDAYSAIGRDPTDAELMMFAQANSEHCRHKIFNADWRVDGEDLPFSLFGMIRQTHAETPDGVIVAYDDNAAVLSGYSGTLLTSQYEQPAWREADALQHIQIKVETHNHPTAISPDPGAARLPLRLVSRGDVRGVGLRAGGGALSRCGRGTG